MIAQGVYDLPMAEDVQQFWSLDNERRFDALVPDEQKDNHSPFYFSIDNVIMALREGLITLEHCEASDDYNEEFLSEIISEKNGNGLQALREKLITFEQFKSLLISAVEYVQDLYGQDLNDNRIYAIYALSERFAQVKKLTAVHLTHLLSDNGMQALREKLITFEQFKFLLINAVEYGQDLSDDGIYALSERFAQVKKLTAAFLTHLFSDNGMQALREKLITMEMLLTNKPNVVYFSYLVTDNGLEALREEIITYEQIILNGPEHAGYLDELFSDNGMHALREGLITPEEAFAMSSHYKLRDRLEELKQRPGLAGPN
ncbi:hypothetical protein [Legionella tunisiensis]|uniref:hypothetical protein n=1 Tax=Legionella tunisiensis TaxID=1034944 RepID=UPI00035DBB8E|nr:hypothetical protein [Legionella tunisiensis]